MTHNVVSLLPRSLTVFASVRAVATSEEVVMVASPSIAIASPPPVALVPNPPRSTDVMSRFMAWSS